ncbi:CotH kinase family protein [Nocardioides stalactiti]|uniref:CotH kinase family protein n=1 Tax=Nocardioides stalactiti TaxID=2755356 RepID=UPI0015FF4E56|nr:CotH kinase family protein [Nocardioides stalactiti]
MNPSPFSRTRLRLAGWSAVLAVGSTSFTGCSALADAFEGKDDPAVEAASAAETVWDDAAVHVFSLDIDEDAFQDMVATYVDSREKEWIRADVTIDGETFRDVGVRLKGNSSLGGVSEDAAPEDLPWLIDLDKYVDGQSLDGSERFVVRSNSSETSLNEAVALDLLEEAGLASEEAVLSRFSVNGSDAVLRLVVEDLDDRWFVERFSVGGTLYKSEAGGDWSYRGDDAEAYADAFDVEAGEDDYAALTAFLQWIEEAADEEFAAELPERLDVEAFATYLAFEDLIGNFDDIDGPGNNSYLAWDAVAGRMTVVAWDHNLAFGGVGGGMRRGPGPDGELPEGVEPGDQLVLPEGFEPPEGLELPEGFEPPEGLELPEGFEPPSGGMMVGRGGANPLVERFQADEELSALYDEAVVRLQAELYDDGTAQEVLDRWVELIEEAASDLVDAETLAEEAEQVSSYFDGHALEAESEQSAG